MSRQSIVAPIGLVTQPNKYGQYKRGALSTAKNVQMRSPGVIGSMPDTRVYRAAVGAGTNRVIRQMFASPAQILTAIENQAGPVLAYNWVTSGGSAVITPPALLNNAAAPGRLRTTTQRGRYFITSRPAAASGNLANGVIAIESEGATTARFAGLTPLASAEANSFSTTDAQVFTPPYSVAYCALIRRTQSDGYILLSAPTSPAIVYAAAGAVQDLIATYQFAATHNYLAGDVLEVYRTRVQTPETIDPGATMFLAVSQILTATDLANGTVTVRDTCPESGLGLALYTNPGLEGADAANYDPSSASDMASFKGHMFYGMTAVPAQAIVGPRVAFGVLLTNSQRLYGIGFRQITGTLTNGSPIITAVNNMRGVVIGQVVEHANFAGGIATIIGTTPTTITVNKNAAPGAVGTTLFVDDLIEAGFPSFALTIQFVYPITARQLFTLGSGQVGAPFTYISNIAQRVRSDGTSIDSQSGVELVFRRPRVTGNTFTLRATNGINYSPPLPDVNGGVAQIYSDQVKENRYAWSKLEQPEHVPPLNFGTVGSGTFYRFAPTRDALWLFTSDGLWRLSGAGGDGEGSWRLDPADPNLVLAARNAVGSLKETVWAYTNRGLVAISDDGGIQEISLGVVGDLILNANFTDTWDVWIEVDQQHQEVVLSFRTGTLGAGATTSYVFNTITKTFVTLVKDEYSAAEYIPSLQSLALGRVNAGSPAANPDVMYFELDTSVVRMDFSDVRYQPLFVSDPFTLKQFQDVTYIFEGLSATASLFPIFDGVLSTSFNANLSTGESRQTAGVPRRCAIAPCLRPGFAMSNTACAWSFRGLSARFTPGGEETERD